MTNLDMRIKSGLKDTDGFARLLDTIRRTGKETIKLESRKGYMILRIKANLNYLSPNLQTVS